jgi:hypothetical protein
MFASLPRQVMPGCVIFLLPAAGGEEGGPRAAGGLIDRVLDLLARRHDRGVLPPGFGVAVLGYDAGGVRPLLPTDNGKLDPRPLADVAAALPPDRRRQWVRPAGGDGEPAPAVALAEAHRLVQRWLLRHPGGNPPLVVHCHDGRGLDEAHAFASRSLRLLATPGGQVLLLNCVFTGERPDRLGPDDWDGDALGSWREWWERSSPLPHPLADRADPSPRGLTVNVWPGRLVRPLFRNEALPLEPPPEPQAPPPCAVRPLWAVKFGNAEGEWEDAFAFDEGQGVAAVSDGASEGIFARLWAGLLVRSYVEEAPDPTDPDVLGRWLRGARRSWVQEINFPSLRWSQQAKVQGTGAAATLLALRLAAPPPGAGGEFGWLALAVGDSCLFWVRDGLLLASFPLVHSSHFAPGPALLRTKVEGPDPLPLMARGLCRPGDVFVLATDAVATHLLQRCEAGDPPDWEEYATVEETAWRESVAALRRSGRMVNDDCTLLFVRVGEKPGAGNWRGEQTER